KASAFEVAGVPGDVEQVPPALDLHGAPCVRGARVARRNFGWTGIAKQTLGVFSSAKQQRIGEAV
ncbi:MAG: hypothetical protein KTR29_19710, partial [Rhodothermaceae bacterium]|nr:hypothetical protein [Rhodothermaceae bacterium]